MNGYARLKAGSRDLVDLAGGCTRAAGRSRATPQYLSDYGLSHKSPYMPVDVVADLEQDVGRPIITEILADLAGFVLVPKAQAEALGLNFHGHFADVSRADTDVEAGMADALRDGQVSPAEAASLLPKVRRAEQEMAELEKDLIQLAAANVTPMRRGA